MSGLSTMVSISFGIALVAGRTRVPRPATGKTALRIFIAVWGSLQGGGSIQSHVGSRFAAGNKGGCVMAKNRSPIQALLSYWKPWQGLLKAGCLDGTGQ